MSAQTGAMSTSTDRLAWGLLGTGRIAQTFATALGKSRTGRLVAVGSRSAASAEKFAAANGAARAHGSYAELLADPAVQAVYISTPHPWHAELCLQAARAGKHILCEKPLALNAAEARRVAHVAREQGVFLMEAFMYRCHPQTRKLVGFIRDGAIGRVGVIRATFSFHVPFNAEGRLFSNALGGGGILDVGCYATSYARLIAGSATGRPFVEPVRLTGAAQLHPETRTDLYAVALAEFPEGIFAQLSCGVGLPQENAVTIYGSAGSLHVPSPYVVSREGGVSKLILTRGGKAEEIVIDTPDYLYALEADAVGDALARDERESAFMSVDDTLGNMAALDAWRAAAGVVYDSERAAQV
jgi:predicted dehydrogenase